MHIPTGSNPAFKQQELAVVGGGDTAAEEAMYLTKYGKKVNLAPCQSHYPVLMTFSFCSLQDTNNIQISVLMAGASASERAETAGQWSYAGQN